jgi:hypothetical protein
VLDSFKLSDKLITKLADIRKFNTGSKSFANVAKVKYFM